MSSRPQLRSALSFSLASIFAAGCAAPAPPPPPTPKLELAEFHLQGDGLHLLVRSPGLGAFRWTLESGGEVVGESKDSFFADRHGTTMPIDEAGDFEIVAEVGAVKVPVESIMSRFVPCALGRRKHVVQRVSPPTLDLEDHVRLHVPRWVALERDASFIVEWKHDGATRFHTTARDAAFERASNLVEQVLIPSDAFFDGVCAFRFGETYEGPSFEEVAAHPGRWEVVVHREGVASLAGSFVVAPSARRGSTPIDLARVETPSEITTALGAVPSTCWQVCPQASNQVAVPVGEHDPGLDRNGRCLEKSEVMHPRHTVQGGAFATVQFDVEEFRAVMRGHAAIEARVGIHQVRRSGRTDVEFPYWEYDDDLSPNANWYARKAYEKQEAIASAQEDRLRASMAAKLVPAFTELVHENGGPFTADEIPAPPAGSKL